MKRLYLDNAATTKPVESVLNVIAEYITENYYNPSASYSDSRKVKEKIEEVRVAIAKEINAEPNEIYFTSGATESNNWVIQGFEKTNAFKRRNIFYTPIEHSSIIETMKALNTYETKISVLKDGIVNMERFEKLIKRMRLSGRNNLVSVGYVNNEIGTIQPIKEIARITHKNNGIFHTDATQAFGKIPIDVKEMGIDLISASAQKIGGLKGIGFLYKKNGIEISPLIYGTQENGQRGGTENVIGIVAFGEALKNINYNHDNIMEYRDIMVEDLLSLGCTLNGSHSGWDRIYNNINVILPENIDGESLINILDTANIKISAGSACNTGRKSHVLSTIGLSDDEIYRSIRITLPDNFDDKDYYYFMSEFKKAILVLKSNV